MRSAVILLVLNLPAIALAAVAGMAVAYEMPWTSITLATIAMLCTVATGQNKDA